MTVNTVPFLGILSLDTAFPRILGDAGNPDSYPVPARVRVVAGAGSPEIVQAGRPAPALIDAFIAAARALEAEGASALVSTCGFLVTAQAQIAAAVHIPVLLSALSLGPLVQTSVGGRPLGILTASASALGAETLTAAGLTQADVRIAGLQDEALFRDTFLAAKDVQCRGFDPAAMEAVVVRRAESLMAQAPEIGAILLECGNLPPYAAPIRAATGCPVFHLLNGAALLCVQSSRGAPNPSAVSRAPPHHWQPADGPA